MNAHTLGSPSKDWQAQTMSFCSRSVKVVIYQCNVSHIICDDPEESCYLWWCWWRSFVEEGWCARVMCRRVQGGMRMCGCGGWKGGRVNKCVVVVTDTSWSERRHGFMCWRVNEIRSADRATKWWSSTIWFSALDEMVLGARRNVAGDEEEWICARLFSETHLEVTETELSCVLENEFVVVWYVVPRRKKASTKRFSTLNKI